MKEFCAWRVEMEMRLLMKRLARRIVVDFLDELEEGEMGGCLDAGLMTGF